MLKVTCVEEEMLPHITIKGRRGSMNEICLSYNFLAYVLSNSKRVVFKRDT